MPVFFGKNCSVEEEISLAGCGGVYCKICSLCKAVYLVGSITKLVSFFCFFGVHDGGAKAYVGWI